MNDISLQGYTSPRTEREHKIREQGCRDAIEIRKSVNASMTRELFIGISVALAIVAIIALILYLILFI